jgi:hypothetical protein
MQRWCQQGSAGFHVTTLHLCYMHHLKECAMQAVQQLGCCAVGFTLRLAAAAASRKHCCLASAAIAACDWHCSRSIRMSLLAISALSSTG